MNRNSAEINGDKRGKKQERRSFGAPPPCAMSASRPFGTISRRRETLRSLDPALGFMVSHKAAAKSRPKPLFSVALLRRGSRPGRMRAKFSDGTCGAKDPVNIALRYCGD